MNKTGKIVLLFITVAGLCLFFSGGSRADARFHNDATKTELYPYQKLGKVVNEKIFVDKDIDLEGRECRLPKGVTLEFVGGIIKNGVLKGNLTQINSKGIAFDRVTIKGSWNVKKVSTKLFANTSYENSLKDVVALAHPKINNTIEIAAGEYIVNATKGSSTCISVCSNTTLLLNGTVRLLPNKLKSYNIISARGKNIIIKGKGTIVGDKKHHAGTDGEWGMGININGVTNATISYINIKDCWGDCIYVGGNSKNVLIENCTLNNGRRQGISVTKADGVVIRRCQITNIGGTAPEYAIDIEPNSNDTVEHVLIENVEVGDCKGGFLATKSMKNSKTYIGEIIIRKCTLSVRKCPIRIKRGCALIVEDCNINTSNEYSAIYASDVKRAYIKKNNINITSPSISAVANTAQSLAGNGDYVPICLEKVDKEIVENNIIRKR